MDQCGKAGTPCSSCTRLLRRLGYSREADRFFDKAYLNWMKACMVLQYAKEGLEVIVLQVAQELHEGLVKNTTHKLGKNACPGCIINIRRKGKSKLICPEKECNTWLANIENYIHRQNGQTDVKLNWDNAHLESVKQDPWALAKLFQGDGCQSHSGPDKADISAILSFMTNCSFFETYIDSDTLVPPVRQIRNDLFHSESLKIVNESLLKTNINTVLSLLQHVEKWKHDEKCIAMVEKIERVRDNKITPGENEEQLIMSDYVAVMEGAKQAHQQQLNRAETTEEYKDVQNKMKKIEDTSKRLICFMDMNLVDESDLRQTLKGIEDDSREMYLEAERRLFEQTLKEKNQSDKDKHLREITPGKPYVIKNKRDLIELSWSKPAITGSNSNFEIRYKEKLTTKPWTTYACGKDTTVKLNGMKGNAILIFQARLVTDDEVGPYSEESDAILTHVTAAQSFLGTAQLYKDGCPSVYTIPMTEELYSNNSNCPVRQVEIGTSTKSPVDVPTSIWLFGETESVRTAMVDNMLNFIVGINFDDDYRFTVKTSDMDTVQIPSSTGEFTPNYIIYPASGSTIDQVVSIVDTPTLGHSGDIGKEEKAVDQVYALFNSRKDIGAICVLIKAYEDQLTVAQIHSLERVVSLFSKDMKKNICALIVCNDAADQSALKSNIRSCLPLERCFVFRSATVNNKMDSGSIYRESWKRNKTTYSELFDFAITLNNKTAESCIQVLDDKKALKHAISKLATKTTHFSRKEAQLQCETATFRMINDTEGNVDSSSCSGWVIPDYCYAKRHHFNNHDRHICYYDISHCHECSDCCHCQLMVDEIHCPFLCSRNPRKENMTHHQICELLKGEINNLKQEINQLQKHVKERKDQMVQISLHPKAVRLHEYIDILIEEENNVKAPGYEQTLTSLIQMKSLCETMS